MQHLTEKTVIPSQSSTNSSDQNGSSAKGAAYCYCNTCHPLPAWLVPILLIKLGKKGIYRTTKDNLVPENWQTESLTPKRMSQRDFWDQRRAPKLIRHHQQTQRLQLDGPVPHSVAFLPSLIRSISSNNGHTLLPRKRARKCAKAKKKVRPRVITRHM